MRWWWEYAACRNQPLEWFYPEVGCNTEKAKSFCRECPVKDDCLKDALSFEARHARHGVWGGLSSEERGVLFDGRKPRGAKWGNLCPAGHELTGDNLVRHGRGYRCRACDNNNPHLLRNRKHCKYGHQWTPENTYTRNGLSYCRACQRNRNRRRTR